MSDYTVLLAEPLVRADFGRITVGDFFRLNKDNQYVFVMIQKCIVEDAESIPFQYIPAIIEAFAVEYARMMQDTTDTYRLQKLFTNRPKEDDATQ